MVSSLAKSLDDMRKQQTTIVAIYHKIKTHSLFFYFSQRQYIYFRFCFINLLIECIILILLKITDDILQPLILRVQDDLKESVVFVMKIRIHHELTIGSSFHLHRVATKDFFSSNSQYITNTCSLRVAIKYMNNNE